MAGFACPKSGFCAVLVPVVVEAVGAGAAVPKGLLPRGGAAASEGTAAGVVVAGFPKKFDVLDPAALFAPKGPPPVAGAGAAVPAAVLAPAALFAPPNNDPAGMAAPPAGLGFPKSPRPAAV